MLTRLTEFQTLLALPKLPWQRDAKIPVDFWVQVTIAGPQLDHASKIYMLERSADDTFRFSFRSGKQSKHLLVPEERVQELYTEALRGRIFKAKRSYRGTDFTTNSRTYIFIVADRKTKEIMIADNIPQQLEGFLTMFFRLEEQ